MTILVAVKKNERIWIGADRITCFGSEYATDLKDGSKIMKLKHAYLATSGYTLLDNIIEHLYENGSDLLDSEFKTRAQVFEFFLKLYGEMKKTYTLVDTGKDTYAGIYNVFLLVTADRIYGIANNLSVNEFERYAAKGAGSDYAQGCLYGLYDLLDDGHELTRLALEAACHFSIYCKEPIDILEVKAGDFGKSRGKGYKAIGRYLKTHPQRTGTTKYSVVSRRKNKQVTGAKPKPKPKPKSRSNTGNTVKKQARGRGS
ncbi:MAG: hypothetical protein IPM23_09225 [Candidatus Melainabacteria bacterium]|nr:hypothetical protein [Candidatus Melainabacteria bacterium]